MTPDELLDAVRGKPDDAPLREQAARALHRSGRFPEATSVLATFVNITAHDGAVLPCLCKQCLAPDLVRAEADGLAFRRDFAVALGRVLHFWIPEVLLDHNKEVNASVQAALQEKLRRADKRRAGRS
jgi:hypothetical protein